MDIAHVHQDVIEGLFLKRKPEFTETFLILAKFAKYVECLLGGITDDFIHCVFLRLSCFGGRKCCAAVVIFLQCLFQQVFKLFCSELICILILNNAFPQHLNEHFKASGRQLNPVELFYKAGTEDTFLHIGVKYAYHTVALQGFRHHALHNTIHAFCIVFFARCFADICGNTHITLRQRLLLVVQHV